MSASKATAATAGTASTAEAEAAATARTASTGAVPTAATASTAGACPPTATAPTGAGPAVETGSTAAAPPAATAPTGPGPASETGSTEAATVTAPARGGTFRTDAAPPPGSTPRTDAAPPPASAAGTDAAPPPASAPPPPAYRPHRRKDRPIDGALARWYARGRSRDIEEFRELAERLSPLPGDAVLEIAPGPGYLAIELARRGKSATGLDLSREMVAIATRNARQAGMTVTFVEGNVSAMPFAAESFDVTVCSAAFKNFADPVGALDEMHRVLRPGGTALVVDLRRDASMADIERHFRAGGRDGLLARLSNRLIFGWLRTQAYTPAEFQAMAAQSRFGACRVDAGRSPIGCEVWFTKP